MQTLEQLTETLQAVVTVRVPNSLPALKNNIQIDKELYPLTTFNSTDGPFLPKRREEP